MNKKLKKSKHYYIQDMLDVNDKKHFKKILKQHAGSPTKATKIQKFMKKHIIFKYFALDERIRYFNYVQNFLKDIPEDSCVTQKQFTNRNGQHHNGLTIDNIIDLEKQMGRRSAYGIIYRTSVKNMLGRFPIASKLMEKNQDNTKEVQLNTIFSNKILKNKLSRHFLLCYKTFTCSTSTPSYYIALNELALGDLWSLCKTGSNNYIIQFLQNDSVLLNIILQCLLSVATFHKLGYIHQDCHGGNFLYHMTEDTSGYYRYKILGKDFYLKNCGYTMMIYDFGLAEEYTTKRPDYYDHYDNTFNKQLYNQDNNRNRPFIYDYYDYRNTMRTFWKEYCYPHLTDTVKPFIDNIMELSSPNKYQNEDELITDLCKLFVETCPVNDLFTDELPANQKCINIKPYIIDDSLHSISHSRRTSPTAARTSPTAARTSPTAARTSPSSSSRSSSSYDIMLSSSSASSGMSGLSSSASSSSSLTLPKTKIRRLT